MNTLTWNSCVEDCFLSEWYVLLILGLYDMMELPVSFFCLHGLKF